MKDRLFKGAKLSDLKMTYSKYVGMPPSPLPPRSSPSPVPLLPPTSC